MPLAPFAAADHSTTCGASDGTVVDGVFVWLRPGCLGAFATLPPEACTGITLAHGEVLGVLFYARFCGGGVWLP